MNQGIMNTVFSAVVGGTIGAAVTFFGTGKTEFENLKVTNLTITKQATLLSKEGKEDVVLKEGSVLANNVVLGRKFVGTQFQGHVVVANRMFTSPDDLVATPMEKWRFFTEIGSTVDAGGEVIVRSAAGPASINQPINNGALLRTGFDKDSTPRIWAVRNQDRNFVPVNLASPAVQTAGTISAGNTFDSATVPVSPVGTPAVASQPDANHQVR
jgi:hypothetical protein